MISRIPLASGDEMLRIGFGRNKGRWFARIDLWRVGWRWSPGRRKK